MIRAVISRELLLSHPLSEEECAPWVTEAERAQAASFASPRRRAEYLTWRTLVRRRLGADVRIAYDEVGAPLLPGRSERLSVAHCDGRVVVCLADRRCAVDIEPVARDFSRVVERVAALEERALSADCRWPGVLWCTKECLYKYAHRAGADFARDLRVTGVDFETGRIEGRAFGEGVTLTFRFEEDCTLVSIP